MPTLQKDVDPFLIGEHDVRQTVAVEIRDLELGSDTRIAAFYDFVPDELRRTAAGPLDRVPDDDHRLMGSGVVAIVREIPLARHNVALTVAVDIDVLQRV